MSVDKYQRALDYIYEHLVALEQELKEAHQVATVSTVEQARLLNFSIEACKYLKQPEFDDRFALKGILDSPFETELCGVPIAPEILQHNAYVAGWEHGAADHRPSSEFYVQMRALGLAEVYYQGRTAGTRARNLAWATAARIRNARKATAEGS